MKIAITGTRGIPNQYGGFEKFAEKLGSGLVAGGHEVIVYNPASHSYQLNDYKGVQIVRIRFAENLFGPAANYFYDLKCLRDALRRKVDLILECGYASAAPWYRILPENQARLITHMDGLERLRPKWSGFVRKLMYSAEKTAVSRSDKILCDNPEIADYYKREYQINPVMIPFGADIRNSWDAKTLVDKDITPGNYYLIVARMEPENNIKAILEGFLGSESVEELILVGDHSRKYGRKIFREYNKHRNINFLGGIFDEDFLAHLRHFSKAIFHGHSVGGTNPSLLEAMAAGSLIIAHENPFNKWVLGENAAWFGNSRDIHNILAGIDQLEKVSRKWIVNNLARIREDFRWDLIVLQYEELFSDLID